MGWGLAAGATIGAVTGHVKGGMSNDDLRKLGEVLKRGQAGPIAVYSTNMADQVAASIKAQNRHVSQEIDAESSRTTWRRWARVWQRTGPLLTGAGRAGRPVRVWPPGERAGRRRQRVRGLAASGRGLRGLRGRSPVAHLRRIRCVSGCAGLGGHRHRTPRRPGAMMMPGVRSPGGPRPSPIVTLTAEIALMQARLGDLQARVARHYGDSDGAR